MRSFTSLLGVQVRYIKSKVSKVQPSDDLQDGGVITLADGTALPYDWLVLALGADTNLGKLLVECVTCGACGRLCCACYHHPAVQTCSFGAIVTVFVTSSCAHELSVSTHFVCRSSSRSEETCCWVLNAARS